MKRKLYLLLLLVILIISSLALFSGDRDFEFSDVMRFQGITLQKISDNGKWISYCTYPDRGNPTAYIKSTLTEDEHFVEKGTSTIFSNNTKWAAVKKRADYIAKLNAKGEKDKPKDGLSIVNLETGIMTDLEDVKRYEFSEDSKWLVYFKDVDPEKHKDLKKKKTGQPLILRHLISGTEIKMDDVIEYDLDSNSTYLLYSISSSDSKQDGIYYRNLKEEFAPKTSIKMIENTKFSNLAWNHQNEVLVYMQSSLDAEGEVDKSELHLWDSRTKDAIPIHNQANETGDWYLPENNKVKWTKDGQRLFFGLKPKWEKTEEEEDIKYDIKNFQDIDTILSNTEVDVWHWNDPKIIPNQKKEWSAEKNRTYATCYFLSSNKYVRLADTSLPDVKFTENTHYTVAYNSKPYHKLITWDGWYQDIYAVELWTGKKHKISTKNITNAHLSPSGKYIAYYESGDWYLYNTFKNTAINLTNKIDAKFYDEDDDTPDAPQPYGIAGWFENDDALMIYDKYDIWKFNTLMPSNYSNITNGKGRNDTLRFRIKNLLGERKYYTYEDSLLLEGFHYKQKYQSIYTMKFTDSQIKPLLKENKKYRILGKAENADRVIFARESYEEFPDIWISNFNMEMPRKISNVNPELSEFKWGNAELTQWKNGRDEDLQGIILKPENYDPNKKYPVLIYFYETFSDRMYNFTLPQINHRPCFQVYLSDGYVVLLPDIKYVDGNPGLDATDALTRGAQHLIDMGIADPKKIAIQGHSWGGYETAFMVTETDMFAAACAGAPVSNMTSAYSGIRLGTGLTRQFQYEQQQSRIGGNLWDSLDNYLRNSPVMQAEKAKTPLLVMFGDIDEAVPWEQGIELYMAFRRLNKNCIFLQYRNEPHHPRKYHNKLDYAIKMKEFFDHYLLGKPAPEWMTKGVPYQGK